MELFKGQNSKLYDSNFIANRHIKNIQLFFILLQHLKNEKTCIGL